MHACFLYLYGLFICKHVRMSPAVFAPLHGMQTGSSDENSVCLYVCLSVWHTHGLWQNGRKFCPDFYTTRENHL